LPGATLVSVGHRSSLLGFHVRVLELLGEGKWRLQELPEPASNAAGKNDVACPGADRSSLVNSAVTRIPISGIDA
jgi:hypothetical protein